MVLTALNYSNLDWFLPNYSLKIFHRLKLVFSYTNEITAEQVYRKFIIYQLINEPTDTDSPMFSCPLNVT